MRISLRCLVGRHSWEEHRTEDGQRFQECGRCATVDIDPVGTVRPGRIPPGAIG